jgi:hypothetical protein
MCDQQARAAEAIHGDMLVIDNPPADYPEVGIEDCDPPTALVISSPHDQGQASRCWVTRQARDFCSGSIEAEAGQRNLAQPGPGRRRTEQEPVSCAHDETARNLGQNGKWAI